jgi:hypothetical protein
MNYGSRNVNRLAQPTTQNSQVHSPARAGQNGIFSDLANNISVPNTSIFGFHALNNIFTNITGGPQINDYSLNSNNLYNKSEGCAIFVSNPSLETKESNTIALSDITINNNNFSSCSKGIVVNGAHGVYNTNTMLDVQCGILNNFTEWCKYNVTANTITNTHMGMQFVGNSGNNSQVVGNHIILNNNYLTMQVPIYDETMTLNGYTDRAIWPIGIDVKHGNNTYNSPFAIGDITTQNLPDPDPNAGGETFSNIIEVPGHGGLGIQMNLTGCGYNLERNLVTFTNQDATVCGLSTILGSCGSFTGIKVSNDLNSMFIENKVKSLNLWNSPAFNARPSTGFYIDQSKDIVLHCNTTSKLSYGFDVRGNCEPSVTNPRAISKNTMNDHRAGWLFRSYTTNPGAFSNVIGVLEDNDNRFNGNYFSTMPVSSCPQLGTVLSPSKILRLTNSTDLGSYFISLASSNTTINFDPNNNTWTDSKSNICNKEYKPQAVSAVVDIDCQQPSTFIIDPDDNPDGLENAEDLTTSTGLYYPLFDEVADFIDKAAIYNMLDIEPNIRTSSNILDAFYLANSSSNIGAIRESDKSIALLLDSISNIDTALYHARLLASANALLEIDNNGHEYENCERWINEIYLQVVNGGLNALDSVEKIDIGVLAQKCPAATGLCVFKARSILAMLVPGMQYYDNIACAASLPSNKNGRNPYQDEEDILDGLVPFGDSIALEINKVLIYPNPLQANRNITIRYHFADTDKMQCLVKDVTGKTVQEIKLNGGNRQVETTIDNVSTGIYTIEILVNEKRAHSQLLQVQ